MAEAPFRFEDLPGEMRLAIYDNLSFAGIQTPSMTSPIGTPLATWLTTENQRRAISQRSYKIYTSRDDSQRIPDPNFYFDGIINLGRRFGYELDDRIHKRWFTPTVWDMQCTSVLTYRQRDHTGGAIGYLRWRNVPRTFNTAPEFVRVSVRPFMDELLMARPWADIDDEASELADEVVDAHAEMLLELGMQLRDGLPDMTAWSLDRLGIWGFPSLRVVIDCYTAPIEEGSSADRGASLWSKEDLVAWAARYPAGTRYYPVPALILRRCVMDLCQYLFEADGTCQVTVDGGICEIDGDSRPVLEVPEEKTIDRFTVTYVL